MRFTDIELKNTTSYESPYGRVMLIGMYDRGPVAQPFTLAAGKNPYTYLGRNPSTEYALRLIEAGIPSDDILYYRLNGRNAYFEYRVGNNLAFDIVSLSADSKHNNVRVTFSEEGLAIQSNYDESLLLPNERNYLRTYRYADYPYTSQLANAINADSVLGLNDVIAREHQDLETFGLFPIGDFHLVSGDSDTSYIEPALWDGETKNNYYQLFAEHILGEGFEGQTVSNIVDIGAEVLLFPDINIDDFPEIGKLSSFIAQQKTESQYAMCYAIFHTSDVPGNDLYLSRDYTSAADFLSRELPNEEVGFTEEELETMEASSLFEPYQRQEAFVEKLMTLYESDEQTYNNYQHLMIAVGNEGKNNLSSVSGDIPLAVLILTNSPNKGLSNREILDFRPENTLTPAMFARLRLKGYTYIVPSVRKNFVFETVQDMNLQIEDSVLKNWSNRRTFKQFEYELNLLFDNYTGGPIGTILPSSLRKELEELIGKFISEGRVKSGTVDSIEMSPMRHSIDLSLSLTFYQEVNQVRGNVEIKKDGWDINIWDIPGQI